MATRMLLRRRSCGTGTNAAPIGFRLPGLTSLLCLTVLATILVIVPASAATAGVLDQAQPDLGFATATVGETSQVAQTFRSGITGSLDQVDVAVSKDSPGGFPLTVEIWPVSAGVPVGPALASETMPAVSIPAGFPSRFLSVPLVTPAPVTAGAQYAIVLTSACANTFCYDWALGHGANPYPRGSSLWRENAGAAWQPRTLEDLAFKTYVVPVVPVVPVDRPTSKADCKKGGWRRFKNPSFKNQGQCIAYVNHHATGNADQGNKGEQKRKKK